MAEGQPSQIGRYKVVSELGRGGFGRVYRAYDPAVGRPVAIKILTQVSEDNRTRFRNEAMVAGNLGHRNIVTVYEYGTHEDLPFLVMEYLEGQDLHQLIASGTPLSLLKKCHIMSEVAEGLYCAHQSGVVHRDMKPGNIMVLRDGGVKIMDFGIARLTRTPDATRLTQQGNLIGTLRYMAPEQLAGSDFDALCDIFAYGVVFYELLTGKHPFEAADAQSLMFKLTFEEPPPLREFVPGIPDVLQEVISRIIHKDRRQRYQSLKDIQFDIEAIRADLQQGHVSALLRQAQELLDKKQAEPAEKLVHEVLELEPSNRQARTLREELRRQMQQRRLRPRMESSLREAEECLAQRQFDEAVRAFEAALALDPENVHLQERIEQARVLAEHAKEASRLLAEARKELDGRNLTAAYRIVSEALRHDPKNPEAAEFLKTIQAYVERRQSEQRVDELIRKAQGFLLIPAYDEAIAALTPAGIEADSLKVLEFLERVRAEKAAHEQKQKLRTGMTKATDLLRAHRLDEAAQCLEDLRSEFPDNQDVLHLLAYTQKEQAALARTKAVERVVNEARATADSHDFEGALAALESALKDYPAESVLVRLLGATIAAKETWQRQQAIQSILENCGALRSKQRLAEAAQILEGALEKYGSEPVLLTLLQQVKAEWSEQRRRDTVRQVSEQVDDLLKRMHCDAAARLIQQALMKYPEDAALKALHAHAQDALQLQKQAQAVAAMVRDATRHTAANEFRKALEILDRGLETYPGNADLIRQRAATIAAKEAREREAERAAAIESLSWQARQRAEAEDFDGALALLDDGLREWPDTVSLREIRKSVLADQEAYTQRQRALEDLAELKRLVVDAAGSADSAKLLGRAVNIASQYPGDEEVQAAAAVPITLLSDIARVRHEMLGGNFEAALEICERYLAEQPDHAVFGELMREVERGRRRICVDDLHRRAAAEPDLQKRGRILDDGFEQYPDETAIADELRLTRNKLALIDSIVQKARTAEQSEKWQEALEQWTSLLTIYNQYPNLNTEIERVRQIQEKALAEAIECDVRQIEHALQSGDVNKAAELLRRAQVEHPSASRFQELAQGVEEIGEKRKRARELLAQAQAASESGRHDECQTCLRQAFQMDESDAAFRKLVLNKLIDHAQSTVQTDWRRAEAMVSGATSLQPGFKAPRAMLRAIAERRERAIEDSGSAEPNQTARTSPNKPAQRDRPPKNGPEKEVPEEACDLPAESALPVSPVVASQDARTPRKAGRIRRRIVVCAGAALLSGTVISRIVKRPGEITVDVVANVSGASVSVTNKHCLTPACTLKLPPGDYTLQAVATGYQTATRHISIKPGQAPLRLDLILEPLAQLLQVNTNFESGQVYLDGRLAGELRDSRYTAGVTPGRHSVRVIGAGADFKAEWKSAAGSPPELLNITDTTALRAKILATSGETGTIICNCGAQPVTVDGAPAAKTAGSDGGPVVLHGLKQGIHQIAVGERSFVVDIGRNSTLNVFLSIDRNVGVLIVQTGEDEVKVFLNNRLYRHTTEHGMLRIPVDAGKYVVRVEKDGFISPEPRTLALNRNEEKALTFALTPGRSYLELVGAIAGAQVRLDGQTIGETDRNGAFRHEVTPGRHALELAKEEYVSVRLNEQFHPGKAVQLSAVQVAMAKVPRAVPPDSKQAEGQDWTRVANSTNPADFEGFIRTHPANAHLEQARARANELRQAAQANAARLSEQAAWDKIDQNSKEQLQNYLSQFPVGAHVREARARLVDLDRQLAEALAGQRLKEQKNQEQAKNEAEGQAIAAALKDFEAAYNRKDLQTLQKLWGGIPVAAYRQQFREATDLKFQLQLIGQPVVNGNSATAICTRTLTYKGRSGGAQTHSERVKVTLNRDASGWIIRSIELN